MKIFNNNLSCNLKILSLENIGHVENEWHFFRNPIWQFTNNIEEWNQQPFKIILTSIFFDIRGSNYKKTLTENIDFNDVDLVLFYDIEYFSTSSIVNWIKLKDIKNYIVLHQDYNGNTSNLIFRWHWVSTPTFYYSLDINYVNGLNLSNSKRFLFDFLVGTPKPHRLYILIKLLKNNFLTQNTFISYRKQFSDHIEGNELNDYKLQLEMLGAHPKDISKVTNNTISLSSPELNEIDPEEIFSNYLSGQQFPAEIYRNSWYSIITEHHYNNITVTEKIARSFFAKRIFVLVGAQHSLKHLRNLGFLTFSDVIDESYDSIENHVERFDRAFDEVIKLSILDPIEIYLLLNGVIEHNYKRVLEYIYESTETAYNALLEKIPPEYIITQ